MPSATHRVLQKIGRLAESEEAAERLAAMLRQDGRHFSGLSSGEAEKVRGHIFAALARHGVPDAALAAVREELRTSLSPIVLAGAARAAAASGSANNEMRGLIRGASERIALCDEYVVFESAAAGPSDRSRTATEELAAALAHIAPAPCCSRSAPPPRELPSNADFGICQSALAGTLVEDQAENTSVLVDLLRARTSVVAFFYTRCMNPAKCSLTVARLGVLARRLVEEAVDANVLGVTYDPAYDLPYRLLRYGRDRNFAFGAHACLVRCTCGWRELRRQFRLQVGYGGSTVNEHAREVFLVSRELQVRAVDPELLGSGDVLVSALRE